MIKAIIFDFYGVFMPDAYDAWLAKNNIARAGIYAQLSENLDTGTITHDQFFSSLSKASHLPVDSISSSFASNKHIDQSMKSIVAKLSLGPYKIGLISNGSANVRIYLKEASIETHFDVISLSSEMGIIKPNRAIFTKTFDLLGVNPNEVLYIDDRIENTEVAKSLGTSVITFTTAHILQEELSRLNLL